MFPLHAEAPGHAPAPAVTADPRQIESWALGETAARMADACREPVDEATLLHAARLNWRLWTIFQASLLDPDCQMPDDIRANILSLANFVDRHTADIISAPDPAKFEILIGINCELAAGLVARNSD